MMERDRGTTFNIWQLLGEYRYQVDLAYRRTDFGAFIIRSIMALLLVFVILAAKQIFSHAPIPPFRDELRLLDVPLYTAMYTRSADEDGRIPYIEVQDEALMYIFAHDAAASLVQDFPNQLGQVTLFLNEFARPGQTLLYGIPSWFNFEARRWLSFFLLLLTSAEIVRIVFSLTTKPYTLTERMGETPDTQTPTGSPRERLWVYAARYRWLRRIRRLRTSDIVAGEMTWRTPFANGIRLFMRHWNGILAATAALLFFWWQPWVAYYGVMSLPSTPVMYLLTAAIAAVLQKRYQRASIFFGLLPLFHQEALFLLLLWLTFLYRLDLTNFVANQLVEIFRAPFREGGNPNEHASWMEDATQFIRKKTAEEQEAQRLRSPLAYLGIALLPYLAWNFLTLAYENDLPFAHLVQLVGNFISGILQTAPYDANLYNPQSWRLTLDHAGFWVSPPIYLLFFAALIFGGLFFLVQYNWWRRQETNERHRELAYLLVEHSVSSRHLWWVFFFGYFLVQTLFVTLPNNPFQTNASAYFLLPIAPAVAIIAALPLFWLTQLLQVDPAEVIPASETQSSEAHLTDGTLSNVNDAAQSIAASASSIRSSNNIIAGASRIFVPFTERILRSADDITAQVEGIRGTVRQQRRLPLAERHSTPAQTYFVLNAPRRRLRWRGIALVITFVLLALILRDQQGALRFNELPIGFPLADDTQFAGVYERNRAAAHDHEEAALQVVQYLLATSSGFSPPLPQDFPDDLPAETAERERRRTLARYPILTTDPVLRLLIAQEGEEAELADRLCPRAPWAEDPGVPFYYNLFSIGSTMIVSAAPGIGFSSAVDEVRIPEYIRPVYEEQFGIYFDDAGNFRLEARHLYFNAPAADAYDLLFFNERILSVNPFADQPQWNNQYRVTTMGRFQPNSGDFYQTSGFAVYEIESADPTASNRAAPPVSVAQELYMRRYCGYSEQQTYAVVEGSPAAVYETLAFDENYALLLRQDSRVPVLECVRSENYRSDDTFYCLVAFSDSRETIVNQIFSKDRTQMTICYDNQRVEQRIVNPPLSTNPTFAPLAPGCLGWIEIGTNVYLDGEPPESLTAAIEVEGERESGAGSRFDPNPQSTSIPQTGSSQNTPSPARTSLHAPTAGDLE